MGRSLFLSAFLEQDMSVENTHDSRSRMIGCAKTHEGKAVKKRAREIEQIAALCQTFNAMTREQQIEFWKGKLIQLPNATIRFFPAKPR